MVCNEENAVEKWYAIREVSEITGVKPVTLRAWQRRYNLVQPERTEKGHRLYSEDNIEMIREIQGWLAKGIAIGKVKDLLVNPDAEGALAAESRELDEVERMLTALSVLNAGKAESGAQYGSERVSIFGGLRSVLISGHDGIGTG